MSLSRWGGVVGIVAVVLLVGAFLLPFDTPDGDAPDQEWIEATDDDAVLTLARAYLFTLSSLALVAFYAAGIRPRLPDVDPADKAFGRIGMGATLLAAAFITTGGFVGAAVGAANMFQDVPIDPSIARTLDNLGIGMIIVGGALAIGTVMVILAIQVFRTRAFAPWIGWVSILAAIAMAASVIFLPFILLPVWVLAVSIELLRTEAQRDAMARTTA